MGSCPLRQNFLAQLNNLCAVTFALMFRHSRLLHLGLSAKFCLVRVWLQQSTPPIAFHWLHLQLVQSRLVVPSARLMPPPTVCRVCRLCNFLQSIDGLEIHVHSSISQRVNLDRSMPYLPSSYICLRESRLQARSSRLHQYSLWRIEAPVSFRTLRVPASYIEVANSRSEAA